MEHPISPAASPTHRHIPAGGVGGCAGGAGANSRLLLNLRTRHGGHANPATRYKSTARERASDTARTPAALAQVLASKPAASKLLPNHIRPRRWLELEVAGIQRGIGLKGAKAQQRLLAEAVQNLQRR